MPTLIEPQISSLHIAKQTDKDTAAATAIKRLRRVSGGVGVTPSHGEEAYGSTSRFGASQHFLDSLIGEGSPGIQATPGVLAYLAYLFAGQESAVDVVGADTTDHEITPATSGPFWATIWSRVGSVNVLRYRHAAAMITGLQIEGSTGQKVVRVTPSITSLDPGEIIASDPVKDYDSGDDADAFIYTEGEGAYTIDGTVIRGQSQFNITLNENRTPLYTDSPKALALQSGSPDATIATTLALDSDTLQLWNKSIYGTASPTAGTKPLTRIPAFGSYEAVLTKYVDGADNDRVVTIAAEGVHWSPGPAVEPNVQGGVTEFPLAGSIEPVSGSPDWSITVRNGDAAYA